MLSIGRSVSHRVILRSTAHTVRIQYSPSRSPSGLLIPRFFSTGLPQFHNHDNDVRKDEKQDLFRNDPKLKELANDFNAHDHIHLQESETEFNDSFIPDAKQHEQNMLSHKRKQESIMSSASSHSHLHSHSHSHTENNPLLVLSLKEIKKNPGVRITWIGLGMNVSIALGKFLGGIVFHSQALLADSVHAASDLISDILTLFSVSWTGNKPTREFPYGYGKIETVGSLAVSTILAMAGVSIGWSSLCAIVGPIIPHTILETITGFMGGHSHSHSHSVSEGVTNINAAWIAAGSIVMKEWIFQATKKIAIASNSNVLLANAWHHRVDSLTSLVALVAITSSHFLGIQSLDAIGGLLVSVLVVKAGGDGMVESMKELIDKSISTTDERYLKVETVIRDSLGKLVSNNNADKPYTIKDLTVLLSGRNIRINTILQAPLQKWGNVLDIQELENVSTYLKTMVHKNIDNVGRLEVEFVQEKEPRGNKPTAKTQEWHHEEHTHTHSRVSSSAEQNSRQ